MKKLICLIALVSIFSSTAYAEGFNDIKGHWAENTINRLASRGIVNGISEDTFAPDEVITRAQYLKMMMELMKIETVPCRDGECLDVSSDEWYSRYLQSALDKGLIPKEMIASYKVDFVLQEDGSANVKYSGSFNGNLPIVRQEMAALTMHIYQYGLSADEVQKISAGTSGSYFSDVNDISTWALPSVKLAVSLGIIEGMDDLSFQPHQNATRAQAVTIIGRILDRE